MLTIEERRAIKNAQTKKGNAKRKQEEDAILLKPKDQHTQADKEFLERRRAKRKRAAIAKSIKRAKLRESKSPSAVASTTTTTVSTGGSTVASTATIAASASASEASTSAVTTVLTAATEVTVGESTAIVEATSATTSSAPATTSSAPAPAPVPARTARTATAATAATTSTTSTTATTATTAATAKATSAEETTEAATELTATVAATSLLAASDFAKFHQRTMSLTKNDQQRFHQQQTTKVIIKYIAHKPNCKCIEVSKRLLGLFGCNSLIVLPENNTIRNTFICSNTSSFQFQNNQLETEILLRDVIFSNNAIDKKTIKVRCAKCLLATVPNGFACIFGTKEKVEEVISNAEAARDKDRNDLHHDHADFLFPVKVQNLRSGVRRSNKSLFEDIVNEKKTSHREKNQGDTFEFGHHLSAIRDAKLQNNVYVMIMFTYDEKSKCWNLDLPGGKRHLGENTNDCVRRETEEESSVVIQNSWFKSEFASQNNCYFLLEPPAAEGNLNLLCDAAAIESSKNK